MDKDPMRRAASKALARHEKRRFEAGDKSAILRCLNYCLRVNPPLPIPKWCSENFCEIVEQATDFEYESWDDAFGRLHPKGTHIQKMRALEDDRIAVYNRVEELREAGEAVDGVLFEKVGRELGIGGKTKVEELYYFMYHMIRASKNAKSFDYVNKRLKEYR